MQPAAKKIIRRTPRRGEKTVAQQIVCSFSPYLILSYLKGAEAPVFETPPLCLCKYYNAKKKQKTSKLIGPQLSCHRKARRNRLCCVCDCV